MKLDAATAERASGDRVLALAGYALLGFLSAGCCLDGRAPLAAGFLGACRPGRQLMAALLGAVAGSAVFLSFAPALRSAGILILIAAILSAFQDTVWYRSPLFRPLAAAGTTASVEMAYLLQMGLSAAGMTRLLAVTALSGLLCHYCALLLRQTAIPRRRTGRETEGLRQRLRLSAEALRSLGESVCGGGAPRKEENPAVVFDRAAEVVCRGCALRGVCWQKEYVSTFNAFNDATPAIMERGRAEPADFALHFSSRCIHFPQLVAAVNTEVTALLLRRQYRRQLDDERRRSRGRYAQLTELVAQAMAAPEEPAAGRELACDVSVELEPREGQRLCGDSAAAFRTGGKLYLLLSDGMGSGREAQRESQLTLRLLEQFLRAGIEPETALKTLNGALDLRGEEQGGFTTVDLLSVDLSSLEAALYKYGAAPTYIKRQGAVRRLTGSALPAGLQEVGSAPAGDRFRLEKGSFLVMVSDGVADGATDRWLQDLLAGWQGEDPHALTSLILKECRQRRHGDDDRSVLCLRVPDEPDRRKGKREV